MRELSLHMLDLLENSVRGGASIVLITIEAREKNNLLRICVEDNGSGLPCSTDQALDPFFTTKSGKKTGLGLSLFQGAAEQAGGLLELGPSSLGGLKVEARMQLSHVDRQPLGDVAATISSVLCVHNGLDLWFRLSTDSRCFTVHFSDFADEHNALGRMTLIRKFTETIKDHLAEAVTGSEIL